MDHAPPPLLTIGIPTYNGEPTLRQTLDSVVAQVDAGQRAVEVFISDNGSTDNTADIIAGYAAQGPDLIRHSRNERNVGFDGNVDVLFKRSSGRFVWLLGDDDVLEPDAIRQVLALLRQHPNVKAVQVNFDKYNRSLEQVVEQVDIPKDVLCRDGETFLDESRGRWGAISSLVIDRDAWNALDLQDAFGSQVIFGHGLFRIIRRNDSFVSALKLVKVREGSEKAVARGNGDALLNIALASGLLYHSMKKAGYDAQRMRSHLDRDRRYVFDAIPRAKYWGIKDKKALISKLVAVHNGPTLWLRWIPLILLPDILYAPVYRLRARATSLLKPLEHRLKARLRGK
jgi:glycosyltransferase involved in cell wall biosynthesis